jgi:SAM-dependent methyltransferase
VSVEEAELAEYLDWLRAANVQFEVSPNLYRDTDHDGDLIRGEGDTATHEFPGHPPVIEHRDRAGGFAADHATDMVLGVVARHELVQSGDTVWDVGCGTGILGTGAALLGAGRVVATDLAEEALELARKTVDGAGVSVELRCGSLLDPMGDGERADLIMANLPHKPVPRALGLHIAQDGGEDGCELHLRFLEAALPRLTSSGRIAFFLHSLPGTRLLRTYGQSGNLRLISWKRRYLQPGEYGPLDLHFEERSLGGSSWMGSDGDRRFLLAGAWVLETAARV